MGLIEIPILSRTALSIALSANKTIPLPFGATLSSHNQWNTKLAGVSVLLDRKSAEMPELKTAADSE